MKKFDIHEAKAQLSKLVDDASRGEPFLIVRSGKPVVKVVPLYGRTRRLGFIVGHMIVPNDFDRMHSNEIERLFGS